MSVPTPVGSATSRFCNQHSENELRRVQLAYSATPSWKAFTHLHDRLSRPAPNHTPIIDGMRARGRSEAEIEATLAEIGRKVCLGP